MTKNRNGNVPSQLQSTGNSGAFAHAQKDAPSNGLKGIPSVRQARRAGFEVRHPEISPSMADYFAQEIRYSELEGDAQVISTMDRLQREEDVSRRVLWDIKSSLVDEESPLHNSYGPQVPENLARALDASGLQHKSGSWDVEHESLRLQLGTQRLDTRLDPETGRLSLYMNSARAWVGGEVDQDDAELLANVLSIETDAADTDRTLGWHPRQGRFSGHLDTGTGQTNFTYRNNNDHAVDFTINESGELEYPNGAPEAIDAMVRDCSNIADEHRDIVLKRITAGTRDAHERMIWNPDTINQRHHLRPGLYRDPYEFHAGVQDLQAKLLAGKTRCELSLEGRYAGLSASGSDYDAQALVDETGDTRYFIDGREVKDLDVRKANQRKLRDNFIEHQDQLKSLAMGHRVGLGN